MRLILCIFVFAFLATSCAKTPSQSTFPYTYQKKMHSAGHWNELAKTVVKEQVNVIIGNQSDSIHPLPKVYIEKKDKSDFGIAFHSYLVTELFKNNIEVVDNQNNDGMTLSWSTQIVNHNATRNNPGAPGGLVGAIGYVALWVIGGDFYPPSDSVPNSEMLLTTKLHYRNEVVSRNTQTIYLDDEDKGNYWIIPDEDINAVQAYVKAGSTVCRDAESLVLAFSKDGKDQLSNLIKQGKCAITSRNYPITITDDNLDYLVFKSGNEPYAYVTKHESTGNL